RGRFHRWPLGRRQRRRTRGTASGAGVLMGRALDVRWDDPAALAAAGRTMPGIDFLRAIRDGRLAAAPIAKLLGFDLVELEPGHAVFECTPASSTTTRSASCTAGSR